MKTKAPRASAGEKYASALVLGLGGSATNDGGFGLARALGWIFRDGAGTEIRSWTGLDRLAAAEPPATVNCPMWEMSKMAQASRTALCSSRMPVYCTGIF